MIGIVYSSKTGNTQSLANSLNFMESKYCVSVIDAKDLEPVDLLCIGFWCDKGDCDDSMKQYLSTLRNQNVQSHLDASNCVKGTWMCQGKMPLAIRAKFESNPEMLKNFDEALKHPNDKDVDSLMKCVNEAL